jgi:ADP-ribosyltransferase exoenzyme
MPGGVWGAQVQRQSAGFGGYQTPRPTSAYDLANQISMGGGSPTYYGAGDNSVVKRQFADVGKVHLNLLDPLAPSRGAVNYQPVDGEDGGLLGLGHYYSPQQPGGLFAGLFGAVGQTLGGVFGEGAAKTGSDIGTFLGKTVEAPLAAVGGVGVGGVPFVTPVIDAANSQIEQVTPYILRDTLKLPSNIGGAFQSMLNIFGLAGTAIERTYAGLEARGPLPADIQKRVDAKELTHDQALDEMVLSARGFTNEPIHDMVWNMLLDPTNWLSMGVGAVGGAVRGTGSVARAFGAAARVEGTAAARLATQGGRLGEIARAAQAGEAITGMVDSRSILNSMRGALDDPAAKLHLSMVERLGMSALGPVSEETGNSIARVGNVILKATDPINFFSGSKAGERSMAAITTAASTGVMAAYKPLVINGLGSMADRIIGGGSDRVYRALGLNGANSLQEFGLSELATDAMRTGAIPRTEKLTPTESVRAILKGTGDGKGGAFDANVGKYIEILVEKNKDLRVGMLPGPQMLAETQAKFASMLGADIGAVAREMTTVSPDQAVAIHALYYYTKGEALHTDVAKALREWQSRGTLGKDINPEEIAVVSPKTLTDVNVSELDAAMKAGNLDDIRAVTERYNDFNWMNRQTVPDGELKATVERWLEVNRPHLVHEVELRDAAGNFRADIPDELKRWAEDSETFGYKLGQKMPGDVPEEAMWRVTRGPNGELINANPYSDFWVEGTDSARKLNRFTAIRMASTRSIRQERIVWQQRRRFITDMADPRNVEMGGVVVPPALADRLFKAIMYSAKERYIQPRGLEPKEMFDAVKKVLDAEKRSTGNSGGRVATHLTERQVTLTLLRAMQGDVGLVGVTQKITGGVKAYGPGAGANYWGRIAEKLYPLMRFTLNPVFQTMEAVEPYVLGAMRGIYVPLRRTSEGYQNALATHNAIGQLIRASTDPDGMSSETAEALAIQAYTKAEATAKFGRSNTLSRFMPHIGQRKDVAAAIETERVFGDTFYRAFSEIQGDGFEAFWGDMERNFGTTNRGQIAMRWMATNFALQDMDGHQVALIDDIFKPTSLGKRMRLTKNGDNGAYTFADVERVFDHVRRNDGSWNQGLRAGRTDAAGNVLEPGEALLADLKAMTREEWHQEVNRSGLNTDSVVRVSESAANDIWNMANGPELDPFWKGYRDTMLQGVTGTSAPWTRLARDQEVAMARSMVGAWATAKGMTEEEFIRLHFDDVPRAYAAIAGQVLPPGSLPEIRESWAATALRRGPAKPPAVEAVDIKLASENGDTHPAYRHLSTTEAGGGYYMQKLSSWYLNDIQDQLMDPNDSGYFYDIPRKGYTSTEALLGDVRTGDAIVRIPKGTVESMGEYDIGNELLNRDTVNPRHWEILTPDGWKALGGGQGGKVAPAEAPFRAVNGEVSTGRHIYEDATAPEAGVTKIDLEQVLQTKPEKASVGEYTGMGHLPINRWLRGSDAEWQDYGYGSGWSDAEVRQHVANIDSSIAKGQLREPMTLYRGISLGSPDDMTSQAADLLNLWPEGEGPPGAIHEWSDPGFFSSSASERKAREFAGKEDYGAGEDHVGIILTLEAPAGMHMGLIEGYEDEHLIPRNTPMVPIARREVEEPGRGTTVHITFAPVGPGSQRGVNKLALGEMPGFRRNEGRMLQDAMQDPEALRSRLDTIPETDRYGAGIDIERAIQKAEQAAPPPDRVTIGTHQFGRRTPEEALAEIEREMSPTEIINGGGALADLRYRARHVMESERWRSVGGSDTESRRVMENNDTRLLAALAPGIIAPGPSGYGFRFGLQRVLQTMEHLWALGPTAVTRPGISASEKNLATHLVRGVAYGIDQPYTDNIVNDATDAILGNTSRRATGRIDDVQPILADDLTAEAAGYLTESAYDDLVGQGLIYNARAGEAVWPVIPSTAMEDVRSLGGSTGAMQVRDPLTGKLYVEKAGATSGHLIEEAYADAAYRAAGVPVTQTAVQLREPAGTPFKRSVMIEGTPLNEFWDTAPRAERDAIQRQLQQHFALDALLANWDVIGLVGDNILVRDGIAYRVDNGGALRYRAMGEPKGAAWGPHVTELDRMRTSGNEWAQRVFGDLTDAEIRRQVLDLGDNLQAITAALPDDVASVVRQRYDDMLSQTAGVTPAPAVERAGTVVPRPQPLGEYEHEYLVKFYNDMARQANERGFAGRSSWTAADIASVASQTRQKMGRRGGRATTPAEFERAMTEVHAAIAPGPGSGLEDIAPLFDILSQRRYRPERQRVLTQSATTLQKDLRDSFGLVIDRVDALGVGLFDGDGPSPTFPAHLLSTPEKAMTTADVVGFVTGQPVVRAWTNGPAAQDILAGDFKNFAARATIHVPATDITPTMAEKMAESVGKHWPDVGDMTAVRQADGSWDLHITDADGTLFPRLESGEVNGSALQGDINRLFDHPEFDAIDKMDEAPTLDVGYGHVYESRPPTNPDGSPNWNGHRQEVEARAAARGTPLDGSALDVVRASYNDQLRSSISYAAPNQYDRLARGEPIVGRDLEDRRGGNLLGVTSPRSATSAVIHGLAAADPLTGLHELIHVFSISGADPSLRDVVSKAFDQYNVGNDAAKAAKLADLQTKLAAAAHPSVRTRLTNQINALTADLQTPHPTAWGTAQEEFLVHAVFEYINRGVNPNTELTNAFEHFRNWLNVTKKELAKPGLVPITPSPQMDALLNRMFRRPGVDTVSHSVEQQTMRMAGQQAIRSAWDEAHSTQFYKKDRSMLERSINHPYIGLYPASYMWGKILPEMVRFLALRPFGMETPFLAWNVAREISDGITAQSEVDPSFKKFLEDNKEAFMLMSMLFPSLPQDTPANVSLPVRRIAEQGLEAQRQYAAGVPYDKVKDIDFGKGAMDAVQYALGPAGTIRTSQDVLSKGGNLVRSALGAVIPPDQNAPDLLPTR